MLSADIYDKLVQLGSLTRAAALALTERFLESKAAAQREFDGLSVLVSEQI